MNIADAKAHLDEALRFLSCEAYKWDEDGDQLTTVSDFTVAEELERIDWQLGRPGSTVLANIADHVRSAYVEIKAARQALGDTK